MASGKTRVRMNRIARHSRLENKGKKEYLAAHPEAEPVKDRCNLAARGCPDYDHSKPYTIQNTFPHVMETNGGCSRCKKLVLEKPKPMF